MSAYQKLDQRFAIVASGVLISFVASTPLAAFANKKPVVYKFDYPNKSDIYTNKIDTIHKNESTFKIKTKSYLGLVVAPNSGYKLFFGNQTYAKLFITNNIQVFNENVNKVYILPSGNAELVLIVLLTVGLLLGSIVFVIVIIITAALIMILFPSQSPILL